MPSRQRLAIREAIALGALQGPTELLPVSSSAHTTLIPWLAGLAYAPLEPQLRSRATRWSTRSSSDLADRARSSRDYSRAPSRWLWPTYDPGERRTLVR